MSKPNLPEPKNPRPEVCRPQDYASQRSYYYDIAEQLDLLFHDIEAGYFGSQAKSGAFYQYLLTIKQAIPKPEVSGYPLNI